MESGAIPKYVQLEEEKKDESKRRKKQKTNDKGGGHFREGWMDSPRGR